MRLSRSELFACTGKKNAGNHVSILSPNWRQQLQERNHSLNELYKNMGQPRQFRNVKLKYNRELYVKYGCPTFLL